MQQAFGPGRMAVRIGLHHLFLGFPVPASEIAIALPAAFSAPSPAAAPSRAPAS